MGLEQLGPEQVADAAHRADERPLSAQLLANVADMHVERAIQRRGRPLVNRRGQLVARDDPAGGANDQIEDIKLDRRQLQGVAFSPDFARARRQLRRR